MKWLWMQWAKDLLIFSCSISSLHFLVNQATDKDETMQNRPRSNGTLLGERVAQQPKSPQRQWPNPAVIGSWRSVDDTADEEVITHLNHTTAHRRDYRRQTSSFCIPLIPPVFWVNNLSARKRDTNSLCSGCRGTGQVRVSSKLMALRSFPRISFPWWNQP